MILQSSTVTVYPCCSFLMHYILVQYLFLSFIRPLSFSTKLHDYTFNTHALTTDEGMWTPREDYKSNEACTSYHLRTVLIEVSVTPLSSSLSPTKFKRGLRHKLKGLVASWLLLVQHCNICLSCFQISCPACLMDHVPAWKKLYIFEDVKLQTFAIKLTFQLSVYTFQIQTR